MDEKIIKTDWRIRKEEREMGIYNEYKELMKLPGAMSTAVERYLTKKYDFGAETTVWAIRKRVEKRLRAEGKIQ